MSERTLGQSLLPQKSSWPEVRTQVREKATETTKGVPTTPASQLPSQARLSAVWLLHQVTIKHPTDCSFQKQSPTGLLPLVGRSAVCLLQQIITHAGGAPELQDEATGPWLTQLEGRPVSSGAITGECSPPATGPGWKRGIPFPLCHSASNTTYLWARWCHDCEVENTSTSTCKSAAVCSSRDPQLARSPLLGCSSVAEHLPSAHRPWGPAPGPGEKEKSFLLKEPFFHRNILLMMVVFLGQPTRVHHRI